MKSILSKQNYCYGIHLAHISRSHTWTCYEVWMWSLMSRTILISKSFSLDAIMKRTSYNSQMKKNLVHFEYAKRFIQLTNSHTNTRACAHLPSKLNDISSIFSFIWLSLSLEKVLERFAFCDYKVQMASKLYWSIIAQYTRVCTTKERLFTLNNDVIEVNEYWRSRTQTHTHHR